VRVGSYCRVLSAAAILAVCGTSGRVAAEDNVWYLSDKLTPTLEWSTGLQGSPGLWSAYTGLTFAPGSLLEQTGWRFRMTSGRTAFWYETDLPWRNAKVSVRGVTSYVELLGGYQWRQGPVTARLLTGLTRSGFDTSIFDPDADTATGRLGGKIALEIWANIGRKSYGQLDLSVASTGTRAALQGRVGHEIAPRLWIGPEVRAARYEGLVGERGIGLFLRSVARDGELTVSGGWSASETREGFYGALNFTFRN